MSALASVQPHDTTPIVATTWARPNVAVVALEGEHDMASVPQLEQALGNALLSCSQLLVDLSSVQFIDSSTIHTLIKMKREADDKHCDFRLVLNGDAPNIEHTLEICGVLGALNRVATVDAALQHGGALAASSEAVDPLRHLPVEPGPDAARDAHQGRSHRRGDQDGKERV